MKDIRFIALIFTIAAFSGCREIPPYSAMRNPFIPGLDTVDIIQKGYWSELTGGSLTLGSDGANTIVTRTNVDEASDSLMGHIFSAYRRAFDFQDSRVSLKQRFGDGKSGHVDVSGSCTGEYTDYDFDFMATFYDYAGWDSALYIGGRLHYKGNSWLDVHAYDSFGTKFVVNGTLDFSGLYSGSITLANVSCIPNPWARIYSGKLLVESDGEVFVYDLDGRITFD